MTEKNNSFIVIEIDGTRFEVNSDDLVNQDDTQHQNRVFHLQYDDKQYDIEVLEIDHISGHCTLSINGQVKEIQMIREIDIMIEKMGLNASHAKRESFMYAPMPGMVTSIKITPGEHVEKGSPLIILEAMKMENVIAAPHDAVVKDIKVSLGQAVERGAPLVEFT
jgi:biotin carboxyl carrier protein